MPELSYGHGGDKAVVGKEGLQARGRTGGGDAGGKLMAGAPGGAENISTRLAGKGFPSPSRWKG